MRMRRGLFSSRGIARKLEEDVAFRVLGAGNFPQHRTLCEFRRRHLSDFKELFIEVVRLARELGLARFGKLSIDGTKVRANASKRKAMSYGRMAKEERRLRGEIEALLGAAGATDAAEDARWGRTFGATSCRRSCAAGKTVWRRSERRSRGWRRSSGQRTTPAVGSRTKTGTRRAGSPTSCRMASRTLRRRATSRTRESGIMKTSNDAFQQCYNAQVAVDGAHQLVVATAVTANASDQGGVPVLLDEVAETVGEQPETVLADAGYNNERDLADLETRGIDGYVSLGREGQAARPRDPEKYPATSRMAEKLSTLAGRAAYAERKWLSEAPTAGSSTCWDSDASACGGWKRCAASGTWCAWH